MQTILETRGLTKKYGSKAVVNNISMHIDRGEVYGFIGRNGAGKTTFMRLVLGLALPDAGEIWLFGGESRKSAGQKIGSIVEAPALYSNCSAYENLKRFSTLINYNRRGAQKREINEDQMIRELIDIVGLTDAAKKKAGHYSLGMKQRLGLAIAMLGEPEFLVLDEPVNGLDPAGIKEIRDAINNLKQAKGVTFLISSHLLDELSKIVTKYGIINDGYLVDEVRASDLDRMSSRSVTVVVDDPMKAVEVIAGLVPREDISVADHAVNISCHNVPVPSAELNRRLVSAGVAVSALHNKSVSVEDYFIERMGR